MRFHGVDALDGENSTSGPLVRHEGESVRLRLWWSVDHPVDLDYSENTFLTKGKKIFDEVNGPPAVIYPANVSTETSRWQSGTFYLEERTLSIPFSAKGLYAIRLVVYFWNDPVPIPAPGVDDKGQLPLLQVEIRSY